MFPATATHTAHIGIISSKVYIRILTGFSPRPIQTSSPKLTILILGDKKSAISVVSPPTITTNFTLSQVTARKPPDSQKAKFCDLFVSSAIIVAIEIKKVLNAVPANNKREIFIFLALFILNPSTNKPLTMAPKKAAAVLPNNPYKDELAPTKAIPKV